MKLNHVGVAVPNIEKALTLYKDIFGYELLSGPFDDPIQHVSVCFLGHGEPGEVMVELVMPLGDQSPIDQTIAKGIGAYHVCYEVDDIDQALKDVRAKGCLIVSKPVPAVAFEGRKIAWFYTPSRQLIEFVERSEAGEQGATPRFDGGAGRH